MTMHPELKKLYIYMLKQDHLYYPANTHTLADKHYWVTISFISKKMDLINDYVTLVPND
jgi:hypothetical protein